MGALVLLAVLILGRTLGVSAPPVGELNPAAFSPGACVAYAPIHGDRHLTVFLDAGHGGLDPGSTGTTRSGQTIHEAQETLPVELDAAVLLRRGGFRVVVSRTRDTNVVRLRRGDVAGHELTAKGVHEDVAARAVCANDAHASVLVGIYFDPAGRSDPGSITGYDAVRSFAADNVRLANLVQYDVLAAMNARGWNIPNGGVEPDSQLVSSLTSSSVHYGHLLLLGPAARGWFETPSQMPGAVIEPLFITDRSEGSIAASRDGQRVIAGGLVSAIEQYFAPAKRSRANR